MWLRILLWSALIGSILMGYIGIQTGSATNAAVGVLVVLLVMGILFVLFKMILHFGFIVLKVLLVGAIIALVVVGGIKGCQSLLPKTSSSEPSARVVSTPPEPMQLEGKTPSPGFWQRARSFFGLNRDRGASAPQKAVNRRAPVEPLPDKISGKVSAVRSGYLFQMGSHFIKLYGIDAPDPQQECLDRRGETYACGRKSRLMLERLILNKNLVCQVAGGDYKENYIATCTLQGIDVGASLLTAGWAVADRSVTDVYIPYEEQAHRKRAGLWDGKFVAPWDARAKRVRHTTTGPSKSEKGFWERLFQ